MQYLLLIHIDPAIYHTLSPEESRALIDAYWKLDDDAKAAGVLIGSQELHSQDRSSTLRVRDGEVIVSDGPFVETKEVLGGYYLIDVPTIEEARVWAARIPDAARGTIEIRPVVDHTRED